MKKIEIPEKEMHHQFNVDPNVMGDDIKMKLTKQKLEKLIMEEYAQDIGDEYKPTNYPEYADKLNNLEGRLSTG